MTPDHGRALAPVTRLIGDALLARFWPDLPRAVISPKPPRRRAGLGRWDRT